MSLGDGINMLVKAIVVVERDGLLSFKNYSLVIGSSENLSFFHCNFYYLVEILNYQSLFDVMLRL
jgi:hypothetical protein